MSEDTDIKSAVGGAVAAGALGLLLTFIKGLFTRNVDTADTAQKEMRSDVKNILLELRSMHDEQIRQRSDLMVLSKDLVTVTNSCKAAHDRIDALVAPPPRRKK